jgi:hypothetical protein
MSGTSGHGEIDWEFGFIVKTPAINLIEIVTKDEAIPVMVITPGSIWGVIKPFAVAGV